MIFRFDTMVGAEVMDVTQGERVKKEETKPDEDKPDFVCGISTWSRWSDVVSY